LNSKELIALLQQLIAATHGERVYWPGWLLPDFFGSVFISAE
jgi:hypothetical protein